MSKIFLFALPILLITGCKSKIKPIPPREMEHVLLDINIAETYSSIIKDSLHKDMSKNMDSLAEYYHIILNHYRITPQQLEENLAFYKANPEALDSACGRALLREIAIQNKLK